MNNNNSRQKCVTAFMQFTKGNIIHLASEDTRQFKYSWTQRQLAIVNIIVNILLNIIMRQNGSRPRTTATGAQNLQPVCPAA